MDEFDLVLFLEWLDAEKEVLVWGNPQETHEDTALKYLAERERKLASKVTGKE